MKPSIRQKLDTLYERYEELGLLLGSQQVISDNQQFRNLSKEYAQLQPLADCYTHYQKVLKAIEESQTLIETEADPELRELAEDDLRTCKETKEQLEQQLLTLLLPQDPDDARDVYLEIRAGAGGNEASIFAGDLFRMYARYAETQGWHMEVMSANEGEHGGYKEIIGRIKGRDVYARLKFESGAHRVQRVPTTESQGRIHTSTCTVAVLPEAEDVEEIDINPADLRVDTYRASGAGGQHVNRTDSAIRITHIPTGFVVECQEERSQHKNRAKAMSLLKARLLAAERSKQQTERAETRRSLVGTGDRSERIRTYNFPQGRLTDHRINLTLYKLDEIMEGSLDSVIQPLIQEHQADLLMVLSEADE